METVRYFIFSSLLSFLAHGQVVETLTLPDEVEEASGVAYLSPGFVYIINDSGNEPRLFEFSYPEMELLGSYFIDGENRDWETLSYDRFGNLYICDIGDNLNQYYDRVYYKIRRADLDHRYDTLTSERITRYLRNEPRNVTHRDFDWESAIWLDGGMHHFSKNRREPFDGKVINFFWTEYTDTLNQIDSSIVSEGTRELNWITDATLSADGRHLFLLTSNKIFAYMDFPESRFFEGYPMELSLPGIRQREGLCAVNENELLVVSEDNRLLGEGKLERIDIQPLIREYSQMRRYEVRLDTTVMDSSLHFQVESILDCDVYYEIYSDGGRVIKRGSLGNVFAEMPRNFEIDTQEIEPGHYILNVLTGRNPHGFFITKYAERINRQIDTEETPQSPLEE